MNNTFFKYLLLSFTIISSFLSCKDDMGLAIEIEIPAKESKLVVNSTFSPSLDTIYLELGNSIHIFDTISKPLIKDATVILRSNTGLVNTFIYNNEKQKYFLDYIPETGIEYTLSVEKEGYNNVIAKDTVPKKIEIEDYSIINVAEVDEAGGLYSKVTINFTDPANEKNYYEIAITDTLNNYYDDGIYTYDNIITNEAYYPSIISFEVSTPKYLPFSDLQIDGNKTSISIFYFLGGVLDNGTTYISEHSINVHLRSVSEQYYKFHSRLLQHKYNQKDDIIFGMSEPLNAYSNIENGFGVFAAYNEDVIIIKIDEIKID